MESAIGIMGGTFNPFHNGHLQLALQAYRQFELSKVLVMPSGTPAHKSTKELIAASHRCQMVSGAIADYPYLELSLLEVERKGNTYTSDTLKALHRQNPDLKIYFIIGADSLFDLPKWHEPEYVMQHCFYWRRTVMYTQRRNWQNKSGCWRKIMGGNCIFKDTGYAV